jgi:hypothetical protein
MKKEKKRRRKQRRGGRRRWCGRYHRPRSGRSLRAWYRPWYRGANCGSVHVPGRLEPRRYLGRYPGRRLRPPLPARALLAPLGHVAYSGWPRPSPGGGSTGPTWPVLPASSLQRQDLHRLFIVFFSKWLSCSLLPQKSHTPLLSHQEHQIHRISSLNHPNPLCFGESKEKTPIYIFTEAICISPSFC